jgi:hypothetical protein
MWVVEPEWSEPVVLEEGSSMFSTYSCLSVMVRIYVLKEHDECMGGNRILGSSMNKQYGKNEDARKVKDDDGVGW